MSVYGSIQGTLNDMNKFTFIMLLASFFALSCSRENPVYELHYEAIDFPKINSELILYAHDDNLIMEFNIQNISDSNYCVPALYSWKNSQNYQYIHARNDEGVEIGSGEINFSPSGLWKNYFIVSPNFVENIKSHRLLSIKKTDMPIEVIFSLVVFPCDYLTESNMPTYKSIISADTSDFEAESNVYVIKRKFLIDESNFTKEKIKQN